MKSSVFLLLASMLLVTTVSKDLTDVITAIQDIEAEVTADEDDEVLREVLSSIDEVEAKVTADEDDEELREVLSLPEEAEAKVTADEDDEELREVLSLPEEAEGPKSDSDEVDQVVHDVSMMDYRSTMTVNQLKAVNTRNGLINFFRSPQTALNILKDKSDTVKALEHIQTIADRGLLRNGFGGTLQTLILTQKSFTKEQLEHMAEIAECAHALERVDCSSHQCFNKRFRTFHGTCNNLGNSDQEGAAETPYTRLLDPVYGNGFNTPRLSMYNQVLPSARQISRQLISTREFKPSPDFTHMVMQFGQFLDHDMDLTGELKEGTTIPQSDFPIPVPGGDPLHFTRSKPVCGSGSTSLFFDKIIPRRQINEITSFVDGSNVYASTEKSARALRDLSNEQGLLLRGNKTGKGTFYLPDFFTISPPFPIPCPQLEQGRSTTCFIAGDARVNENLGLISMHTIWFRQHNRLAAQLKNINGHWNGERIYQEARKIVGAQLQEITFEAWLPRIIGREGVNKYLKQYTGYKANVDPTITNDFTTAAFRFGHTLVNPFIERLGANFQPQFKTLPLSATFFRPFHIVEEGGIDPILRGLLATSSQGLTNTLNSQLTEHLFQPSKGGIGEDLAARNIQRGRDHGLPGYNSYRSLCGLRKANNFNDLANVFEDANSLTEIRKVYRHVNDIDLFVGGILERPASGARVGPLFQCLIGRQFQSLRDGDRFFYKNPGMFTPKQLAEIQKTTLGRIICDNSDGIKNVQFDVFKKVKSMYDYKPCTSHQKLDIKFWRDCCRGSQSQQNGEICVDETNCNLVLSPDGNRCVAGPPKPPPAAACQENNVAFFGNTIRMKYSVSTWQACSAFCRSVSGCRAWSYYRGGSQCYAKTSDSGRGNLPGYVSGASSCGGSGGVLPPRPPPPTACQENNIAFFHNTIRTQTLNPGSTWKTCSAYCRQVYGCKAWSYYMYGRLCYAKTSDRGRSSLVGYVSGSRSCGSGQCSRVGNFQYNGGRTLKVYFNVPYWQRCGEDCQRTSGCRLWSYNTIARQCTTKTNSATNGYPQSIWVSGTC